MGTLVHGGHPVVEIHSMDGLQYIEQHFEGMRLVPEKEEKALEDMNKWMQYASMMDHVGPAGGQPGYTMGLGRAVSILSCPTAENHNETLWEVVRAIRAHPNPWPECGKLSHRVYRLCSRRRKIPTMLPGPIAKMAVGSVARVIRELESSLDDGRQYLAGKFGLADIFIATNLNRLDQLGILEALLADSCPCTSAYWERIQQRKSFQEACNCEPEGEGPKEIYRLMALFKKNTEELGITAAWNLDETLEEEEE